MKNKNWFWGLFFILSAVSIIAIQTGSFVEIGLQSCILGALLVALIISSLIYRSSFGVFLPLAFLYIIFSGPLGFPYIDWWVLILASVLANIGFSILFHTPHKHVNHCHPKIENMRHNEENIDDNNPYAAVNFGSSSKYLHSDCLQSGKFFVSFGELEVFFDQVQLSPEGAEMFLDCSFGSLILNIPKNWRVVDNVSANLGSVSNKVRTSFFESDAPVLTLTGSVKLGSIEIKYI